jgi:hypothetical protein
MADDAKPDVTKAEESGPLPRTDGQLRATGGTSKPGLWPHFYFLGDQLKFPEVRTSSRVHVQAGQPGWRAFFKAGTTTVVMIQTVIATVEPLMKGGPWR